MPGGDVLARRVGQASQGRQELHGGERHRQEDRRHRPQRRRGPPAGRGGGQGQHREAAHHHRRRLAVEQLQSERSAGEERRPPPAPPRGGPQRLVGPQEHPGEPGHAGEERVGAEQGEVGAGAGVPHGRQRRRPAPAAEVPGEPPGTGEGDRGVQRHQHVEQVVGGHDEDQPARRIERRVARVREQGLAAVQPGIPRRQPVGRELAERQPQGKMEQRDVAVGHHPRRRQQRPEQAQEPARRQHDGEEDRGGPAAHRGRILDRRPRNAVYFCGQRTKKPSAQRMSWS